MARAEDAAVFFAGLPFTYQGALEDSGGSVTGTCEFEFSLWDSPTGGTQLGSAMIFDGIGPNPPPVDVADGVFTVTLDANAMGMPTEGSLPYLEIRVCCPAGTCIRALLDPRQPLTYAPAALSAQTALIATTALSLEASGGTEAVSIDGASNVGIGTSTPTEKLDVVGNIHASGTIHSGNSVTVDGPAHRIDSDLDLDIYVGGTFRALRLEQGSSVSPNVIAGYSGNNATAGVVGAAISGGGQADDGAGSPDNNRVTDRFGTIGGGQGNQAGDAAGGTTDRAYATVGGGWSNNATGFSSTAGGGSGNTASGSYSAVGGGYLNVATDSLSNVGGGGENQANGNSSTVGGGANNHANGNSSTVGGGKDNTATEFYSTIGGGDSNTADGVASTVGGGRSNSAVGTHSTVPGGMSNSAASDYTLAAGRRAKANHAGAYVWADSNDADFSSTGPNQYLIRAGGGMGVNTNDPFGALHVVGNSTFGNLVLDDYGSAPLFQGRRAGGTQTSPGLPLSTNLLAQFGGAGWNGTDFSGNKASMEMVAAENWTATAQGTYMRFITTPIGGTGTLERMRIADDGNVGVGTPTPSSALDVEGSGATTAIDINNTAADGDPMIRFQLGGTTTFTMGIDDSDDKFKIGTTSLATGTRVTIDSGGNVGIGTFAPANRLDVEGGAAIGASYSGLNAAPANGLIVEGDVAIGTISPANKLDVEGNMAVGSSYSGIFAAPANGLIVQGNVGIGTTSPATTLEVAGSCTFGSAIVSGPLFVDTNTLFVDNVSNRVGIGTSGPSVRLDVEQSGATVAAFNRTTNDGTIVSLQQDGAVEGTISVSGTTVSYNNFTGSHYGRMQRDLPRGTLVVLTGDNWRRRNDPGAEPHYGIAASATANDPKCLGAYLGLLEPAKPHSIDNPHQVMAIGNGDMWVVDAGRNLQPGDYLISSDVTGHAMLDDAERFAAGYVVARSAEPVDWAQVAEIDSASGRKHKRISVFFESFERGSAAGLGRIVAEQQRQIEDLKHRLNAFESAQGIGAPRAAAGTLLTIILVSAGLHAWRARRKAA